MEWILTLPPLVNVPQPNFMADEYDKYAKIHQIKYFTLCKKILLRVINNLEVEMRAIELYIKKNENSGYLFQLEYGVIQTYNYQISVYS